MMQTVLKNYYLSDYVENELRWENTNLRDQVGGSDAKEVMGAWTGVWAVKQRWNGLEKAVQQIA